MIPERQHNKKQSRRTPIGIFIPEKINSIIVGIERDGKSRYQIMGFRQYKTSGLVVSVLRHDKNISFNIGFQKGGLVRIKGNECIDSGMSESIRILSCTSASTTKRSRVLPEYVGRDNGICGKKKATMIHFPGMHEDCMSVNVLHERNKVSDIHSM